MTQHQVYMQKQLLHIGERDRNHMRALDCTRFITCSNDVESLKMRLVQKGSLLPVTRAAHAYKKCLLLWVPFPFWQACFGMCLVNEWRNNLVIVWQIALRKQCGQITKEIQITFQFVTITPLFQKPILLPQLPEWVVYFMERNLLAFMSDII